MKDKVKFNLTMLFTSFPSPVERGISLKEKYIYLLVFLMALKHLAVPLGKRKKKTKPKDRGTRIVAAR